MPTRQKTREKIGKIEDESVRERLLAMLDLADSLQSGKTQEAKDLEKALKTVNDEAVRSAMQARLDSIGENAEKSDAEILNDLRLVNVSLSEAVYHGLGKIATAETDRIVRAPERKAENGNGEDETEV